MCISERSPWSFDDRGPSRAIRDLEKVPKRHKPAAAARNLGLLMLKLFGIGKPTLAEFCKSELNRLYEAATLSLSGRATFRLRGAGGEQAAAERIASTGGRSECAETVLRTMPNAVEYQQTMRSTRKVANQ